MPYDAESDVQRYRRSRVDDRGVPLDVGGPMPTYGWEAFFGALQRQKEEANANGMNYRADLSGIGSDGSLGNPGGGRLTPQDREGIAGNVFLGQLTDQNRARLLQDKMVADQARADAVGGLQKGYEQQTLSSMVPLAKAPVTTAGVDAKGNPAITMRPNPSETPIDRLSSLVPGGAQPVFQAQLATLKEKADADALAERKQAEVERANRAKEAENAPFLAPKDATGTPLTGAAVLQTLPSSKQNLIKRVLSGEQAIPSGSALKDPYWKGVVETAGLVDPNFDTTNYNARSKTRQDFTSGKAAGQINAINTAVGHLHDLATKGDQLGNFGLNWVNSVYNTLTPGGSKRGVALNDFNTLKEGVGTELMRVWRQVGAGSEKEIEDWKRTIGDAKSPEELRSAFSTVGGMLESKLGALDSQYKQGMGTDAVSAISPESRAKLDALEAGKPGGSSGGGTVKMRAPNGAMRDVPADQVNHYLQLGAVKVGG